MEYLKPLEHLRHSLACGGCTQMGIGPMSLHCVDAVVELANSLRQPLMLIASRRQIDARTNGGGYVNHWSTEDFVSYVRKKDVGGYVVLCRDHGGPWQGDREVRERMSLKEAMDSAKKSFEVDIESAVHVVHIDPSIDIHTDNLPQSQVLERLFELYDHCMETGRRLNRRFDIEIGNEEQNGHDQDLEDFRFFLDRVQQFCQRRSYPKPLFVVAQTGTLVKETINVGTFENPFRQGDRLPSEIQIPKVVDMCRQYGVHLKEHNADYLSNEALGWHPRLGIHATNIAPEFGVAQSKHFLRICGEFQLRQEAEGFLKLAYESGKWKKWMLPETTATDEHKAITAGHYVFSAPEFIEIFERVRSKCATSGFDVDASIRDTLKLMMMRMIALFRIGQQA